MKKKMFQFRNQFFILGLGSLMIVSCTKEDLDDIFGKKDGGVTTDTTEVDNGGKSCLTCDNDSIIFQTDSVVYDQGNNEETNEKDSTTQSDTNNGSEGDYSVDSLSNANDKDGNAKDSL